MTAIDRFAPEFRRSHLGASQVPAAIGVSPFTAPIELWEEYVHGKTSTVENDAMRLGQALEGGVAEVAAERLGLTALPMPTHTHAKWPWLVATPDRLLSDGTLLQVKTTALATVARRADIEEMWGEEGSDEIPVHVIAQCMTEMEVMRSNDIMVQVNRVAALIPGRGVALFQIEWDEDLWQSLFKAVSRFWVSVTQREEPPVDDSAEWAAYLTRKYPHHTPGAWIDADAGMRFVIDMYLQAKRVKEDMERAMEMGASLIKSRIGVAEGIRTESHLIPWRTVKAAEPVQWNAVHREVRTLLGEQLFDEIVERNTQITSGTTRRFGPIVPRRTK